MAKQITDWMEYPETDRIYVISKGEVIVKQSQLLALNHDLAYRLNQVDAQAYPVVHQAYLDAYTLILKMIRESDGWVSQAGESVPFSKK